MSNRVLLTADIHIASHRGDMRRLEDGLKCLQWIYDTASENEINTVIIAGDFMHNRFVLPTNGYSKACDIIANAHKKNIKTIFLLGNHDMYHENSWSVHSLTPLSQWATVVNCPMTIEIQGQKVDFLPYTPLPSKHIDFFTNPSHTLISHLSVADAILNAKYDIVSVEDDTKEKEIVSAKAFSRWKKVWLGHFHYGQKVADNLEYIGSPMQLTYGEAGQKKHVVIYDLETLNAEYIENKISPKFHIVESPDEIDKLQITDGYIQVRANGTIENAFELKKKLSKLGVRECELRPSSVNIKKQTDRAINNITGLLNDKNKLVDEFADKMKTEILEKKLDLETVKKIGKEIVAI